MFLLGGVGLHAQTVQTVQAAPIIGGSCSSSPVLQFNEVTGNIYVCHRDTGWQLFGAGSCTTLVGDVTGSCAATLVAAINGAAVPANPSTSQILIITAANTFTYKSIPLCTDSNGQHLNFTTIGFNFSCGTSVSAASGNFSTLTDQATVPFNAANLWGFNGVLTFTVHGGSRTLNVSNLVNGGQYQVKLVQDATGNEGLILGTGCTWKVSGGGNGAITLSTGALAVDLLQFTYDGVNCLATLTKNYS